MRVVVVEPPREHLVAEGVPAAPDERRLGIGLLRWFDPEHRLTVIVKATFTLAGERLALADEQPPLSLDQTRERPGGAAELYYPSDFVPFKPRADVLLLGHAYAEPGTTTEFIDAQVTLGDWTRSFGVAAGEPAAKIPLSPEHLRGLGGESLEPVGPQRVASGDVEQVLHEADFDFARYNVAPSPQRMQRFTGGPPFELSGLSPQGTRQLELPPWLPRVLVHYRGTMLDTEVEMAVDSVWIDTDAELLTLVWRGQGELPRRDSVDRLSVSLEHAERERDWDDILRNAARGSFRFAAELAELEVEARDEREQDLLSMARYEAMAQPEAPDPTVTLEQYADISAELAEQREDREQVLRRHGFDENRWLLEERGWLETMANRASAGDGTLVARYGELFVAAQDRLAMPDEADASVADYAELLVALEQSQDPALELEQRNTTLARWLRLDRRVRAQAAADEASKAELERLVAAERARRTATQTQEEGP